MFATTVGLIAIAWKLFKLNSVLAFWMAYILTRPLGASIGDFLSQKRVDDGLGLGTVGTSALFLTTILGLVIFLSKTHLDRHRPYEAMGSVHVLVNRTTDFSLPSDHATAVGAVAVGLWLSDRPLGKVAVVLAIIMAFTRVYVGAHYPADVLAGLALGGITAGIGAKHGTRLLEATIAYINRLPHASAITGSRA